MALIEIVDLYKSYGEGENLFYALKNVNISIEKGDFVAIIGQSGSGKSTLMNILGCLDTPTSGCYLVDGRDTSNMTPDELARLRGEKFGFIFQRYNLLTSISAAENVALPAVYAGMSWEERMGRADQLLADLGLTGKEDHKPNELSGGQQQRVSIARALMNGGEIILADEPTGALDSKSGEQVMAILKDLNAQGHTILMVTHDPKIASNANRIIEIKDGEVISDESKVPYVPKNEAEPTRKKRNGLLFFKDQLSEAFSMSVQAIFAHKLRSALTMLGIIIGIASVVSMVALGQGSQQAILADINSMGTTTITIAPGTGFGDRTAGRIRTMTVDDSIALSQQSYISGSSPVSNAAGSLVFENIEANGRLTGVSEEYFDISGDSIAIGRFLSAEDIAESAAVVVIDDNTRNKLFTNGQDPIGQILLFNKQPLEVIGVAAKQDGGMMSFGENLNMWSPYSTVMNRLTGVRYISQIVVGISDDVDPAMAELNLTQLLTSRHNGVKDFFTQNSDSVRQVIESTMATMTTLIAAIAAIALVVGGIGVMNIMLVSVTERTKEIGVRMAIGARQGNVLQQFLIEAILLCMFGGALGVLLAAGIGAVFDTFVSQFSMAYSASTIGLAIAFSSLIGIVFGYYPAKNASQLNPVDALARE